MAASKIWKENISSKNHLILFYRVLIATIYACLEGKYSRFDAHTTTNCCHGLTLLTTQLIRNFSPLNLKKLLEIIETKISEIETTESIDAAKEFLNFIPSSLVDLASLYTLTLCGEVVPNRGRRTAIANLKQIAPVNVRFCDRIVSSFQRHFASLIATSYSKCLLSIDPSIHICKAPVNLWGKYVGTDHLRKDNKGCFYASCLFSIQVLLAYLIQTKSKIAIVNDIYTTDHELKDRCVYLLQGDGKHQFIQVSHEEISPPNTLQEPVVVFWGRVISDTTTKSSLDNLMKPWLDDFPSLILGGETWNAQFPRTLHDPAFNSTPITPEEPLLQEILASHHTIMGVSMKNPSLFYLTHIYPFSLNQVRALLAGEEEEMLPGSCFYFQEESEYQTC